jgi:zinc protease
MGTPTINRTHPDFPAVQVLNTVLGGYFGSRLMTNIREDKGYTYGIGSGMTSLKQTGSYLSLPK